MYNMSERQNHGTDTEKMYAEIDRQRRVNSDTLYLLNLQLTSLPYNEFYGFKNIYITSVNGIKEFDDSEIKDATVINLNTCEKLETINITKSCYKAINIKSCYRVTKLKCYARNSLYLDHLKNLKTFEIAYSPECPDGLESLTIINAQELENITFETVDGKRTYITRGIIITAAPKLKKNLVLHRYGVQPSYSGDYFTNETRVVERPPPELLHSEEDDGLTLPDYGPDTEKLLKTIKDQLGNNGIFLTDLNLTSLPYKDIEKFETLTLTRVNGLKEINDNEITDENFIELTIDECPDLEKVILKKQCLGHFEIRNCDNVETVEVSNASYNLVVSSLSKLKTLIIHYVPDCGVNSRSNAEIDELSVTDVPELENIEFEKVNDKRTVIVSEVLIHEAPKLKKGITFSLGLHNQPELLGDYFTDQPRVVERELPAFDNNRRRGSESESEDGLDTYSDLDREQEEYYNEPKPAFYRNFNVVEIPEVKVKFTNQKIYDFINLEEIPLLNILCKSDEIIFKAKDSYFSVPRKVLRQDSESGLAIRYKCKVERERGPPSLQQVELDQPYMYISGVGNFLVKYDRFISAVGQYKIIEFVETSERIPNVTSEQNIQTDYRGINMHGNQVNITSGYHCQPGASELVSDVRGVILETEESGGRKTRKQIRKPSYKTRKVQNKSK